MSKTITFTVRENVDLNQLQIANENGGPQEVIFQLRPTSIESVTFEDNED